MTARHVIEAQDARQVAETLASLWACEAYPTMEAEDAWVVLPDAAGGAAIEVRPSAAPRTGAAFSVATPWSESTVADIAAAAGWRSRLAKGARAAVQVWLENRTLVEVVTDAMLTERLAATPVCA